MFFKMSVTAHLRCIKHADPVLHKITVRWVRHVSENGQFKGSDSEYSEPDQKGEIRDWFYESLHTSLTSKGKEASSRSEGMRTEKGLNKLTFNYFPYFTPSLNTFLLRTRRAKIQQNWDVRPLTRARHGNVTPWMKSSDRIIWKIRN